MIDLMKELSNEQKKKMLYSPVHVECFDTNFISELTKVIETLERKRKIAARHPDSINSVFFKNFIDAFTELISDRLLKRYFATIFTIDITVPNEELTKQMLNMSVKYNSPTGELEHPS